jgi:hypothetical protein
MNNPNPVREFLAELEAPRITQGSYLTPAATFRFDGRDFPTWSYDAATIALLYLAKKARGGDRDAAELLDARRADIRDAAGQCYYPVPAGTPHAAVDPAGGTT